MNGIFDRTCPYGGCYGTYDSGIPPKCRQPSTVGGRNHLVIVQLDIPIKNSAKQFLVIGLFFNGMGKEKVFLVRDQMCDRHLLDTQKHITFLHFRGDLDTKIPILPIRKYPYWRRLYDYPGINIFIQLFFTGPRGKDRPSIRRDLSLPDDSESHKIIYL